MPRKRNQAIKSGTLFEHCNILFRNPTQKNVDELAGLLSTNYYGGLIAKHIYIPYVSRLLIALGEPGISTLEKALYSKAPDIRELKILEALYGASKGVWIDLEVDDNSVDYILKPAITKKISQLARDTLVNFVIDSMHDYDLFYELTLFMYMHSIKTSHEKELDTSIFEIISKSLIKINERILREFESLMDVNESEEAYQKFLQNNPCLIDPLAFDVLNKARMGVEHTTDFVLRRLDNEYILVEIEKPSSIIFTKRNDFSATFTHAMGQVLDFQEWIEGNIAYAEKLFPHITSPQGLLIIGMKKNLSSKQIGKLSRFNINNRGRLRVITFDELVEQGKQYLENLYGE